ncbi:MAG TPA: flagellar motor protein MotB [Pseudobdellovibrionaceae bacterium]|nr:flagellar motor protein MotB [Pseudobdellovibrionaceae bacterium]
MEPKKRLPRVERHETLIVHEDDNQHLWAVSYSDFLMALLSFFILFFSVEGSEQKSVILNLAQTFSSSGAVRQEAPAGTENPASARRLPAALSNVLSDLNVEMDSEKKSLIVNFPNDIFLPGQYRISEEHQGLVRRFLETVKPYEGQIRLYFEGHADSSPLRRHKSEIISDNFVLSSLRASSVLSLAKKTGFSDQSLFIQAASSNHRNSRSISVRIEPKQETL